MTKDRKYFLTWLIIITAIGCALRLFRLNEIPFTFDELSALTRTRYNNLHDLIHLGVAGDGHPAGVQVFLYYWTRIFGEAEWVVKLPFITAGILCIPLIYRIGTRWFGYAAGIIAACLMAGLQFTVMYSQIARPYISGLFLVLLLVVILNELVIEVTYKKLLAFAVVLALCAYNHYFSVLTAGCVVGAGFFIIERKGLLKYVLSLALAAVFFMPHLHLFMGQLKLGGLEWLGPPTPGFISNYLYYIFNFSNYILVALALLIVQGVYLNGFKINGAKTKYRFIALSWFLIPLVVGYLYSKYRAPVLQNSVLIFSTPFLILFICSFIKLPVSYFRSVEIAGLMLVLVVSLGWERSYYKIFYKAETEMFARHISGYERAYGSKVAAVVNATPAYLDYYKKKYPTGWSYQTFDSISDNVAWRKWLDTCEANYLILCNPPREWGNEYLAIAREYFVFEDSVYNGFTTDIYILYMPTAKANGECVCGPPVSPSKLISTYGLLDSTGLSGYLNAHKPAEVRLGNYLSSFDDFYTLCDTPGRPCLFRSASSSMHLNAKMTLNASVEVHVDSVGLEGSLNMRFMRCGKVLQARQSLFQSFVPRDTGWYHIYTTARLYHAPFDEADSIIVDLNAKPGACLKIRNFALEVFPDNPILYSLIKK